MGTRCRGLGERRALDLYGPRRTADSPAIRFPRPPQARLPRFQRPLLPLHELVGLVVQDIPLALSLVPAAFLGKVLGTAFLKKISEGVFRAISLGVVILTGILGVATALRALL